MNPTPVIPSVSSWMMSPYVLSSFGAVVALGFIIFALVYFVLKVKNPETVKNMTPVPTNGNFRSCMEHTGMVARVVALEDWKKQHEIDYREILRMIREKDRGHT